MHRARRARGGRAVISERPISVSIRRVGILAWIACLALASPSAADWNLYTSAGLGISTAVVDTDGVVPGVPTPLFGKDDDSSPLLDAAFGLQVPMDEIVPRDWLPDLRLPRWPVRIELEAAGLREFELQTKVANEKFFTELISTTLMVNSWLDIPLISFYRPIQYTFSLGRQPMIRRVLEPASFYVGSGVGFSATEIDGTSNVVNGKDDIIDFAWNVGAGFNYALTDRVDLSAGYRYVGIGDQEIELFNGNTATGADLEFVNQIHEFRFQLRVNVFEFLSPWR